MPVITANTPFVIGESINNMLRQAQLSGITCQCAGSAVVLRGAVATTQLKQRAISIARRACGMREIANEIHVVS